MLAAQPIDFRKSMHTRSVKVSEVPSANPYCGNVFVFRSKPMDRAKFQPGTAAASCWLRNGCTRGTSLGRRSADGVVYLSATQLAMLLDGLE
ncbi:IS66 family insertion sequence element accessory protein TnpB [Bradyrhizobium sp. CCGB12]|uniref:IS66 family insertion sequence element accessory protein TnpB n=1 Tax=Bradyrhizobium sp. CCGB12 TaxID=2949632 RepID=UPI0035BFD222